MALNQVKKIVDCKFENGQQLYEVKWNNTWEPADKLIPFQKLIDEFWKHINDCKNADINHPKKKRKLDSDGVPTTAAYPPRSNENAPTSPTQAHYGRSVSTDGMPNAQQQAQIGRSASTDGLPQGLTQAQAQYVRQMSGEAMPVISQMQHSTTAPQQQQRPGTPQQQQQRPGTPQQKRPVTPQQHPGLEPQQQHPGPGSQQQHPGSGTQQQHPGLGQQQQQHPVSSASLQQRPGTPQQHMVSVAQQQHPVSQGQQQHPVSQGQQQHPQQHSPGPQQHPGPGGQKQHPGPGGQKPHTGPGGQQPHPGAGPPQSHPGSVPTSHPQQPGSGPQQQHPGPGSTPPPHQQLSPGLQTHPTPVPQQHPSSTPSSATMMMHSQAGPFPSLAGSPFDIFAQAQGFMPGFDPKIFENVQQRERGRGSRGGRGRGSRGSKGAHPAGLGAGGDKASMDRQAESMMNPQGHMLIGQMPFDQAAAFMDAGSPGRGRGRGRGRGKSAASPSPNKEMPPLGISIKEEEGVVKQEEFQLGFEMQQQQPQQPSFPDGSSPSSRGRGGGRGRGRGRGAFPSPSKNNMPSMGVNIKEEEGVSKADDFQPQGVPAYNGSSSFNDDVYANWTNPYAKVALVCRVASCSKELNPNLNKNSWKSHYESHFDIKNFGCYCCEKRFRLKGDLKKHITTVHKVEYVDHQVKQFDDKVEVPPVDPATCNDGFVNPYVRSVFQCNICSKELNPKNKGSWKSHYESHTNFKRFGCYVCLKAFRLKGDLKKHVNQVHHQELLESMIVHHDE